MNPSHLGRVISVLVLTGTLAGCGGSSDGKDSKASADPSSGSATASDDGAEPPGTERKIKPQKPCAKVDVAAAGTFLKAPGLKVVADVAPQETYTNEGGMKVPSNSFLCKLSSTSAKTETYVSINIGFADKPLKMVVAEELEQFKAGGAQCAQETAEKWGASGTVLSCALDKPGEREVFTVYLGEFDRLRVSCSVGRFSKKSGALEPIRTAADQICNDTLDKLSS